MANAARLHKQKPPSTLGACEGRFCIRVCVGEGGRAAAAGIITILPTCS